MSDNAATRYLTDSEEKQLFSHVWKFRADTYALRDYYWMQLLRQTGMRIGNLARLTVGDARAALADPQHALRLRDADSKRGRGYVIKFNVTARDALHRLLKLTPRGSPDAAPLVPSRHGDALSIRSFQARMRKWVLSAGLGIAASPHWFRHTKARRILAESTSANALMQVKNTLGHSSINSTVVYSQPTREELDEAWNA